MRRLPHTVASASVGVRTAVGEHWGCQGFCYDRHVEWIWPPQTPHKTHESESKMDMSPSSNWWGIHPEKLSVLMVCPCLLMACASNQQK